MKRKRGQWSTEENDLVLEGINKGMQAEDVQKMFEEHGIIRHLSTLKRRIAYMKTQRTINTDIDTTSDLRSILHAKEFWTELQQQLTTKELGYFEAQWVKLFEQFQGDILPSEEMQLKNYIVLSVLIGRTLADTKYHREKIMYLRNLITEEMGKDESIRDDDKINNWESLIAPLESALKDFSKEHTNLLTRFEAIGKDLKANRDARVKHIKDAKTNWLAMLKALDEEETRRRMGDEAELLKLAKNKERVRLSEWHTYVDGHVDQPLLNSDTIVDE